MLDLDQARAELQRLGHLPGSMARRLFAEVEQARAKKGVSLELWPFAISPAEPDTGIYLLSGLGPWVSDVLQVTPRVWDYADLELLRRGALAGKVWLHGTSTRDAGAVQVNTFAAVVRCPDGDLVRDWWPDALPVSPLLHERVGRPPTHGAGEAPTVRQLDAGFHALRCLAAQLDKSSPHFDAETEAALRKARIISLWRRHLAPHKPALYTMYDQAHGAA